MKIAMITPNYDPPVRGNAVTVSRIERHLTALGHQVTVHATDASSAEAIGRAIVRARPDLIHAFHGWAGGRLAREIGHHTGIPYLITLTGSDVYEALDDGRREETLAALADAAAVVTFHRCVRCRVLEHQPALVDRIAIIPQGVELPGEEFDWGAERLDRGEIVFFLPAGLRPVKNIGCALAPLADLYASDPRVRLLVAGPVLDAAYAGKLRADLERHPCARYLGEVPRQAIGALYRRADVVLNTSLFEGGMANSVLEAMAFGKPVLASAIEGNRSLVKEGETGLLFRGEGELHDKALVLARDEDLRRRLGERGAQLVRESYSPGREASAYQELYGKILATALPTD